MYIHAVNLKVLIIWQGFKSKDGVPQLVNEYLARKLKLDEFVTHTMTLERVNDAIELMKHGKWYAFQTWSQPSSFSMSLGESKIK